MNKEDKANYVLGTGVSRAGYNADQELTVKTTGNNRNQKPGIRRTREKESIK
jgi:hypothetical protein